MASRRFTILREFHAFKKGERNNSESRPIRVSTGPGVFVFADLAQPGEVIAFQLDAIDYEVDRRTFIDSTRRAELGEFAALSYPY
jgi:hypothetical protein